MSIKSKCATPNFKSLQKQRRMTVSIKCLIFFFQSEIPGCFRNEYRFYEKVLEEGPFSMDPNGKLECKSHCLQKDNFKFFGLQVCVDFKKHIMWVY